MYIILPVKMPPTMAHIPVRKCVNDLQHIAFHSQWNYTHTHPFNGPFSGTTQMSRYQKGKTNLDFTEATDSEWQ